MPHPGSATGSMNLVNDIVHNSQVLFSVVLYVHVYIVCELLITFNIDLLKLQNGINK